MTRLNNKVLAQPGAFEAFEEIGDQLAMARWQLERDDEDASDERAVLEHDTLIKLLRQDTSRQLLNDVGAARAVALLDRIGVVLGAWRSAINALPEIESERRAAAEKILARLWRILEL